MSQLNVDDIYNNAGTGGVNLPAGVTVSGITTLTGVVKGLSDIRGSANLNAAGITTLTGHVSTGSTVGAAGSIYFPDSKGINFGNAAEGDLQIYHDGSNSYISETGTGKLIVKGSAFSYQDVGGTALIDAYTSRVDLSAPSGVKLKTDNAGVVVTGILTATGDIETTGGNLTVGLGKSINIDGNYDTVKIQERSVGVGTTSTTGRDAGIGTATGTMIFNSTQNQLQVYDGTTWKRAAGEAITATGGSLDTSGRTGYTVHTITGSGAFNVVTGTGTIEYAFWGGGAGGSGHAGGGGGGAVGFRSGTMVVSPGPYAVTIGAGGAGGPTSSGNGGGPAGNSSLTPTIIAYGGGGGGDNDPTPGKNGGSGGGAGGSNSSNAIGYGYNPTTPSPTLDPAIQPLHPYPITQGFPGGVNVQPTHTGGGGGGSGAVGGAASPTQGGTGGAGAITSIPGSPTQKGGGGGAGAHNPGKTGGAGGAGGGAAGSPSGPDTKAPSASANTASGGGGGGGINGSAPSSGGDGGSGVMYIAYEN